MIMVIACGGRPSRLPEDDLAESSNPEYGEKSITIMGMPDSAGPESGLRSGSAGRYRHVVMPASFAGPAAALTAYLEEYIVTYLEV
jgi:hypothetical protein